MSQHDPRDPNSPHGDEGQQGFGPQAWQSPPHGAAWHGGAPDGMQAASYGAGAGAAAATGARAGGRPIPGAVATAGANERLVFVRKTYAHLGGAIFAFAALCWLWLDPLKEVVAVPLLRFVAGGGFNWLIFLGAFIAVSYVDDKWAQSPGSRQKQYLGLGLYVLFESLIFVPLLFIASVYGGGDVIPTAAVITLLVFGGLTATVFVTRKDFSFLGPALGIGAMAALGLIVAAIFIGFSLGIVFAWAMVVLASGYILYYTSRVLGHYHPQQYVAASLALFSAVALLFWYVIQIVMDR